MNPYEAAIGEAKQHLFPIPLGSQHGCAGDSAEHSLIHTTQHVLTGVNFHIGDSIAVPDIPLSAKPIHLREFRHCGDYAVVNGGQSSRLPPGGVEEVVMGAASAGPSARAS